MFSHSYEPKEDKETHEVGYSHIASPHQNTGKNKEIKNMVTNAEQEKDLNIQRRKTG